MLTLLPLKKWHLLLMVSVAIFSVSEVSAQLNIFFAGGREAGLANTGVAYSKEWAMFHNPGRLTENNNIIAGAHYTNQFMLSELSVAAFNCVVPVGKGVFGASTSYYGTVRYNQQKYSLGYAHRLNSKVSIGAASSYASVNLPEGYESEGALIGEVGLTAKPVEKLTVACHLYNVTGNKYSKYYGETLPSYFAMGAAWNEDLFMLTTETKINRGEDAEISVGGEANLFANLAVRVGASNSKMYQYTFGVGYSLKMINCDLAFARHPTLGFSSFLSFHYTFLQSKQ